MHVPALALFISEDAFAAALDRTPDTIEYAEFKNTSAGVEELLEWLDPLLAQEEAVDWIATIPNGEGGPVFTWLYDEIPDLFLQNPASLKTFAERANLPWDEARTLLTFHRNKVW